MNEIILLAVVIVLHSTLMLFLSFRILSLFMTSERSTIDKLMDLEERTVQSSRFLSDVSSKVDSITSVFDAIIKRVEELERTREDYKVIKPNLGETYEDNIEEPPSIHEVFASQRREDSWYE